MKSILLKRQSRGEASKALFLAENANKAIGYLRNLIVSWNFGFSGLSDLYFFVFGIASAVSSIFGGALSATLIPYSQRLGSCHKRQLMGMIVVAFSLLYLLMTIVLVVLMVWLSPGNVLSQLAWQASGILIISGVIFTFLLLQLMQIADEYFKSRKNFYFGVLGYLAVGVFTVVTLYDWLSQYKWLIGWAPVLPATIICFLIYGWLGLARFGGGGSINPYFRQIWPLMLSGSVGIVNVFVDRWFAAGFSDGRLSILQTALMLITQLGGIVVNPIINSSYPFISSLYQRKSYEKASLTVAAVEKKTFYWMAFFVIGYILIGKEIIWFFYRHGQVSPDDALDIYHAGIIYLPVLCCSGLVGLYLKVLYCNHVVRLPAFFSGIVVFVNVILSWAFSAWIGWKGLALAASTSSWFYYAILLVVLKRKGFLKINKLRTALISIPTIMLIILILSEAKA